MQNHPEITQFNFTDLKERYYVCPVECLEINEAPSGIGDKQLGTGGFSASAG